MISTIGNVPPPQAYKGTPRATATGTDQRLPAPRTVRTNSGERRAAERAAIRIPMVNHLEMILMEIDYGICMMPTMMEMEFLQLMS